MIRKPAVAGQFYPGSPEALRAFLDEAVRAPAGGARPDVGVVSTHDGYVYSGRVAGEVFASVAVPDTVVLLGPNHTGLGTEASVATDEAWATPLGPVPVDGDLARALLAATPLFQADGLAHAHEHSLEVQLPFLVHRNPAVRIVPVTLALRRRDDALEAGRAVAEAVAGHPGPVLVVASSDMTHYEPEARAREKDRIALERVLALDPGGLLATVRRQDISMCGAVPTAVMLEAARRLGATGAELVRYTTSAEASGDTRRVVGYAGVVVR